MEHRGGNIIVIAIITTICSLFSGVVVATDKVEEPEKRLVYSIAGDVSADGNLLTLSIKPGEVATHAIRVFSEPSHTLLVAVIDRDFGLKADAWRSSWIKVDRPLALVTTDLFDGQPRVHVTGRPKSDDRIAVYVYGSWPDGSVGETLVSDARVGQESFSFSTSIVQGEEKGGFDTYWHCCQGGSCGEMCTTCNDKAFECCLLEGCCWIECGWYTAQCTPNCGGNNP